MTYTAQLWLVGSLKSVPELGVGAQLHHIIAAESVLAPLLPVVGADGLAIQEGAIQAACVCDLPAALACVPPDDHVVA